MKLQVILLLLFQLQVILHPVRILQLLHPVLLHPALILLNYVEFNAVRDGIVVLVQARVLLRVR